MRTAIEPDAYGIAWREGLLWLCLPRSRIAPGAAEGRGERLSLWLPLLRFRPYSSLKLFLRDPESRHP